MTINKISKPYIWPRFDEQHYLEFCPSVATLPNGEKWVAFRRNQIPPVWGAGEIWMVRVDTDLHPVGDPFLLIDAGEDPRLLVVEQRLFLMYVYVDRNEQGEIIGTTIAIAEIDWKDDFQLLLHLKLPQNPLGSGKKPDNSMLGYEKNWVPFYVNAETIGILYSHSPWIVLELSIAGAPANWGFRDSHQHAGLEWGYGEIRGGSVPIDYGNDQYITFFHSSAKSGGKKIYYGGACTFSKHPPYAPQLFTPQPVITSPFKAGSDKHGWYLGQPIIFPLGVAYHEKRRSFDILCSLDDAFICLYAVPLDYLEEQLDLTSRPSPTPRLLRHRKSRRDDADLYVIAEKDRIPYNEELIRFFNAIEVSGDHYIDISNDDGDFLVLLHNQFRRCHSVPLTPRAQQWRQRNLAVNCMDGVDIITVQQLLSWLESSDGTLSANEEIWIRVDVTEVPVDLERLVPAALQKQACILLAGISEEKIRALHAQFDMSGYKIATIASQNRLMYLLIDRLHIAKYDWFI